jgi:23S rRNA (guanosine2251-2'-O)-methyltransferase
LTDQTYIYGLRPILEAIGSGKEIEKLLIQKGLKGELYLELYRAATQHQIPVQSVPADRLNRYPVRNHQGVIALVSPIPYYSIEDIIPEAYEKGRNPLVLILDGITDVRNFGAMARTAECTGVDAIVVPARGSAQINADSVKTSSGALMKVPVCRSFNLYRTCVFLRNSGLQIISGTEKGNVKYHQVSYLPPTAVILGSEEKGISPELIKLSDHLIFIPLLGDIQSLNVSVAAGVILYECIRQRQVSD